ncbi:predicted protein [Lichtheimia corymbifera JMRC:FSU:9682]|uniref:BHLH domain-containing protein n=1 Tax=Lichtheimia corymbifera JMRC:FSU:9682 TaxID=1263082 RepID=A0A068S9Y7_9FUNG|nr:predicted protein [Lichtheimia corymbifera JMRC:FSU:9682]
MSSSVSTASDYSLNNSHSEQRRLSLHNVGHSASSTSLPSIHAFSHVTPPPPPPPPHTRSTLPMHPSPLHHSPDLMSPTDRERRESLPSIQHLTAAQPQPPLQQQVVHDPSIRRHSIHTTKIALANDDINQRRSSMTPYSRTPELRASHKLAERRRRKEMKELFDDLLNVLPIDKGAKTSKWEILSKAVDYIGDLRQREAMFAREKDLLLKEKAAFQNRRDYP